MMVFRELIRKLESKGMYAGQIELDYKLRCAFEGFSGRATETWESQHVLMISCSRDPEKFPTLHISSKRGQPFDDFINKASKKIIIDWKL